MYINLGRDPKIKKGIYMNAKKIIAALLCAVMLLSTLVSCSDVDGIVDVLDKYISGEMDFRPDNNKDTDGGNNNNGNNNGNGDNIGTGGNQTDTDTDTDTDVPDKPISTVTPDDIVAANAGEATVLQTAKNSKMVILRGIPSKDNIINAFAQEDFEQITTYGATGARFETVVLSRSGYLVTLYWNESASEMRIIWETVDDAVLSLFNKNANTGKGTLTVAQVGLERGMDTDGSYLQDDNPLNGMCYVIKLSDGRAIIIDGGNKDDQCASNIYKTLVKMGIKQDSNGKYVIAAWIFTHAHSDHIGAIYNFSLKYSENTTVENFLYNFPYAYSNTVDVSSDISRDMIYHEIAIEDYPEANIITPHANLKYYIGNAVISMLYTHELLVNEDESINYFNNTSLIFKLGIGSNEVLYFGDAAEAAATKLTELYSNSTFDSDILQITHHAMFTEANGGHTWTNIRQIYDATGARYAFLPLHSRYAQDTSGRNGRFTMLSEWTDAGYQISYVTNENDIPISDWYYFDSETRQSLFTEFEEYGTVNGAAVSSFYGYNGKNIILSEDGLTTYMGATTSDAMVTVFELTSLKFSLTENEKLSSWLSGISGTPETPNNPETPDNPDDPNQPESTKTPEEILSTIVSSFNVLQSSTYCKEVVLTGIYSKDSIVNAFINEDFQTRKADMIEGARFETIILTRGVYVVTLYWYQANSEMRVMWESVQANNLTSLDKTNTTGTGSIQIAQIGTERVTETDNPFNGICQIIKLSNGKAIIIDGGFNNTACAENLYNSLEKLNIAKDKYGAFMIEAWIFTHGHNDHMGTVQSFTDMYSISAVSIDYFMYNFPGDLNVCVQGTSVAAFNSFLTLNYPDTKLINPHAGLKYYFGNATISMLYTPELLYSDTQVNYYNDTSLIFKVEAGGTSILYYGDAAEKASEAMWNRYDSTAFKSDILQITHHGLYTSANSGHTWDYVKKVYNATEATYAILPMHSRYQSDSRNGRYTVMVQWCEAKYQISYVMNEYDKPSAVGSSISQEEFTEFEQYGTVNGVKVDSIYGYDGVNKVVNENGLITYLAGNHYDPMVTIFELSSEGVTITENEMLYTWLEAAVG